jgi:hypothetical protein
MPRITADSFGMPITVFGDSGRAVAQQLYRRAIALRGLRPDPRPDRRHPDQDRPLPPVRERSREDGRPGCEHRRAIHLPPIEEGDAVEIERAVSSLGHVSLVSHQLLAVEIPGCRPVGIRIEPASLTFYDLDTRELLPTRANPLTLSRSREYAESGRPDRHRDHQRSRSGRNDAYPTPA